MIEITDINVAIFDFDGTVLDSEPLWCELSSSIVKELCGGRISFEEWKERYQHKPSVSELVVNDFKLNKTAKEFRTIRNERFKELCQNKPEAIAGRAVQEVMDHINCFSSNDIPMYIVSCSFDAPIKEALQTLGILDKFVEIRGDVQDKEYEYLRIAKNENAEVGSCMVFEDSEDNIEVAQKLGMRTFLVKNEPASFNDLS